MVQGTPSPDPSSCVIRSLGFALIRLPCCCLHSSSSSSSPSQTMAPHFQDVTPCPQMENKFCCFMSLVAFPSCPPHLISNHTGFVGSFLIPICLYTLLAPHVPEPGSSALGHRRKVKDGPCHSLSCSSKGRLCHLSSHSPQWMRLTIYGSLNPRSCECRKAPQPSLFQSQDPCTCYVFFQGCFPT